MIYSPIIPLDEYWVPLNILDIRKGIYEISNYGNVRRIEDKFPIKAQILHNGCAVYRIVNLVTETCSQPKKYLVHRLVGIVFIPNPENHEQINHMNNSGMDNCVVNLEWSSAEYNMRYQSFTKNRYLTNLENYNLYTMIEQGSSNNEIVEAFNCDIVTSEYVDYMREVYMRNNTPSEFVEENRVVNSSRFPNKTTGIVCGLFQNGMTPKDFLKIARMINADLPDKKSEDTFRMYCVNLYKRKHHTHISQKYNW